MTAEPFPLPAGSIGEVEMVDDAGNIHMKWQCGRGLALISKLTLKVKGEVIYNYDRGEDIPPQKEAAEKALAILLYEFN